MDEKIYEHSLDAYSPGMISSCCGASIVLEDICSDCKEHCDPISVEELEDL
jgi:hypothetical protein